jgi:hypothetical protein
MFAGSQSAVTRDGPGEHHPASAPRLLIGSSNGIKESARSLTGYSYLSFNSAYLLLGSLNGYRTQTIVVFQTRPLNLATRARLRLPESRLLNICNVSSTERPSTNWMDLHD